MKSILDVKNKVDLFEKSKIRHKWHDGRWFFSVIDIVRALTDSTSIDGRHHKENMSDLKGILSLFVSYP